MAESEASERPAASGRGYQGFLAALLGDRERFFEEVVAGVDLGRKLRYATVTLLLLAAFYGAVAGAYSSALQALSSALKLPVLYVGAFAICFPVFFVVQMLVGSRLGLAQMAVLVMTTLALIAVLLAAFVPIVAFFLLTGSNYYFLELLHVVIGLATGVLGMYALHEGLAVVCEKHNVYPRKAMTIMRVWVIIFAFVGIQLAWNLRPFLGDRDAPFKAFRHYEGNFYAAIIYSVNQLRNQKPGGEETSLSNESQPLHNWRGMEALVDSAETQGQAR
jgi:hypothetical protein